MTNPQMLQQMFSPEGMSMMAEMQRYTGGANPLGTVPGGTPGTQPGQTLHPVQADLNGNWSIFQGPAKLHSQM